jgi:amino acid transporter
MFPARNPARRKMLLVSLIAATYFMVSGGPYGIEDILGGAGFAWAIVILLVLPIIWSLPTTLMIGELASAIPAEGGFYVWVRRGLGPFWGYQESWLSLTASIFDMALYPSIFVLYLGKFSPALTAGWHGYAWSLAVVLICGLWNLRGAPAVGLGSEWLFVLLLSPYVIFVVLGFATGLMHHPPIEWAGPASVNTGSFSNGSAFSTAILVAMWNYMGWDNASTIAQEVENPQQNYPRAMIAAAILTSVTYILPLAAMAFTGLSSASFSTGDWADAARQIGGRGFIGAALALAVVAGGCINGVGMFNALGMSYTRLPMAMAEDAMLPAVFARRNRRGVPWVSVLFCSTAWALALNLPFERLISIDLILYGTSLLLEFAALVALRIREPELLRPFRAGNFKFACLLGVGPTLLIAYALYASHNEKLGAPNSPLANVSALVFAAAIALLGPPLYALTAAPLRRLRKARAPIPAPD